MAQGFIMVDIDPGHEQAVQTALKRFPGVKFAYQVTGEHDVIAFIDAEPYEELAVTVASIRRLTGVRDTETVLVLS